MRSILVRPLRVAVLALALALVGVGAAPAQAATLPPGPTSPATAPSPIDAYASYQAQSTCDPSVKPGAQYVLNMAVGYYGGRASEIGRACGVGGTSEHKEGRALDWGVNVANPAEKAAGDQFVNWLTAPGPDDKVGYNARRLGVMYVIWNRQIWSNSSSNAGWRAYTGASPHTDHVHVSLSWAGANVRSSWWTGVALPSDATTRRYVTRVYQDLFGRSPDPAGLSGWSLSLTSGTPRVTVANAITYSTEYRSGLVSGAYQAFLGRAADVPGMNAWLDGMARGLTIQALESGFIGSQEYYDRAGGSDSGWVRQLYRDVLGREANEPEVGGWTNVLAGGTSRQSVSIGFVISTERLSSVVNGYYLHLLGRTIDPTGQQGWVSAIQHGARSEDIIGGIVASEEYYGRVQNS
ncbi:DUF4214 domain-containing protein [Pengzhenrongella frigida]|uniref:DUF4214 domain-containing protein n=1 Tax=Pengzhenrongella frigida TaxID=1259133 RepID=A0A4Q5N417_9MICO|nr:DUF4214 domain-containing protein [Cellulomonas sp. HLT2-17]RYV51387.1 DUF4214 domain-containing protein [Cellulomonas sp. HLT2-17]